MFGYIRAYKPEMRFKEFETYRALYCSLCRVLGKDYGVLTRLTLSYDGAFMVLLGMAVDEHPVCYQTARCRANPFKKCQYCRDDSEILHYAAAVSVLLGEAKVRDDLADHRGLKRMLRRLIHPWYRKKAKKAAERYPDAALCMEQYLENQRKTEESKTGSMDAAAEPTALALSALFGGLSDDASQSRVLSRMGYLLGKWVYLADAVSDAEADQKQGTYNPLLVSGGPEQASQTALPLMNTCLVQLAKDHDLLAVNKFGSILDNILLYGLPEVQRQIMKEKKK